METIYLFIGIAIVIVSIIDFIWTTLWVDGGAGPLTDKLSSFTWTVMRKVSNDHAKMLSLAGPLILSLTLLMWIALLWIGWTFIFSGSETSLINTTTKVFASFPERLYYAGYLIFTLGNGDFAPNGSNWQIVTVVATGSGMLFITLGVTYLLSVLSAVTDKRSFATSVSVLGQTSAEIVESAWNGKDFTNIDLLLQTFSAQLSTITAQHNAYPVLHYYYAENRNESVPVAVVLLDEALSILRFAVPIENSPNRMLLQESRGTIGDYLEALKSFAVAADEPPGIELDDLRSKGLPVLAQPDFDKAMENSIKRRQQLSGLIESSAAKSPWQ